MKKQEKKCIHGPCKCKGAEVKQDGYCSPSCKDGRTNRARCACGHAACQ